MVNVKFLESTNGRETSFDVTWEHNKSDANGRFCVSFKTLARAELLAEVYQANYKDYTYSVEEVDFAS